MDFRTEEGLRVDLIKHSKNIIRDKILNYGEEVKVYVGTDSQNKRRKTTYAVVVVFRYGHRGAHYVFSRFQVKKIRDRRERLMKECEHSIDLALKLRENGIPVHSIDLDFNKDKKFGSNAVVQAAQGWCEGLGFKANVKPELLLATKAADHLCR